MARRKRTDTHDEQIAVKQSDIDSYDEFNYFDDDNEQKILDEINDSLNNWISYFNVNISNFRSDKFFAFVDNWTPQQRTELVLHQKPVLQMNKVYDALNKVIGEQRQNTAELEVRSLTGEASDEEIKLNQDFLRHICFNSKSKIAYQTAFADQAAGGFGAFRIRSDYIHPDSFEQSILIEPIKDPEKCFFDPYAQDPTKKDGDFCGYYISMNKKDFERQYPDIEYPVSFPVRQEIQDFTWGEKDKITLVEYHKKVYFDFKLHKLSDGRTVRDDEWKKIEAEPQVPPVEAANMEQFGNVQFGMLQQMLPPPKPTIIKTITKKDCKIVMFKAIYNKIIERKEFPSKELPIIFVSGASCMIDGQERTMSFIRFAKDAQTFHNYQLVEIAYALKTSRRERFMGTSENISGYEEVWKNIANVQGMLPANPDSVTKQLPIPIPPSEVPSSLMGLFQQSEQSIQSILGFYEANRGADSIEKSGVAIKEQQRTGNMSVAVLYDNLNRAIEQAGRGVMSMKSIIYDTERMIPIMNQNGKTAHVMINQKMAGGMIANDMTKGSYDVVIDAGPSAAVQKSQSLDILVRLCGLSPQIFPLVADYLGENLSLDSISGIVKRFKTLVPPDVIAMEEGKPPPQQPPNPQLMLAQQQMQIKEKDQQIQMGKLQIEMQKMETQIQQLQKEIQVTEIKAQAEIQKAAIDHNSKMVETTGKIIGSHNDVKRELIKR
jgi:hypothetical protein